VNHDESVRRRVRENDRYAVRHENDGGRSGVRPDDVGGRLTAGPESGDVDQGGSVNLSREWEGVESEGSSESSSILRHGVGVVTHVVAHIQRVVGGSRDSPGTGGNEGINAEFVEGLRSKNGKFPPTARC
jgi:hypothetical protein